MLIARSQETEALNRRAAYYLMERVDAYGVDHNRNVKPDRDSSTKSGGTNEPNGEEVEQFERVRCLRRRPDACGRSGKNLR